jgi:hypothetical protein
MSIIHLFLPEDNSVSRRKYIQQKVASRAKSFFFWPESADKVKVVKTLPNRGHQEGNGKNRVSAAKPAVLNGTFFCCLF